MRSAEEFIGGYRTVLATALLIGAPAAAAPPATRVVDATIDAGRARVADPYQWLEEAGTTEVITWVAAQNAEVRQFLGRYAATHSAVLSELEALFDSDSESAPQRYGSQYFLWKRRGLQDQPLYIRRAGGVMGEDRVVLDPNVLSRDGSVSIDWAFPTWDGATVAYGTSRRGDDASNVMIRDLTSGLDHASEVYLSRQVCNPYHTRIFENVTAGRPSTFYLAWDPDQRGYHYVRRGAPPRPGDAGDDLETTDLQLQHVVYHRSGGAAGRDRVVFTADDPRTSLEVSASADTLYTIVRASRDELSHDVFLRPCPSEQGFVPLVKGVDARFEVDVFEGRVFILTDDQAPRGRLLSTPATELDRARWNEVIPQRSGVLRSLLIANRKLVLHYTEDGYSKLHVYTLGGEFILEIPLPPGLVVTDLHGHWNDPDVYIACEAFDTPPANYRYNIRDRALERYWQREVKADTSLYADYEIEARADDGTVIPIRLVHRKDLQRDGNNPTLLRPYKEDPATDPPAFDASMIPWVQRGGVIAIARTRGDNTGDRDWRRAGLGAKVERSVSDFEAAARKLIEDKFTRPQRLAVGGTGVSSLPALALMTRRPELAAAAVFDGPVADLLRFDQVPAARRLHALLGDPSDPADASRLARLSPAHNVKDGREYPSALILTDQADDQIGTLHAWKLAARLQAVGKSTGATALCHTLIRSGLGASKPIRGILREDAMKWTFLMAELGMAAPDDAPAGGGSPD